jgi:hypothetical protein
MVLILLMLVSRVLEFAASVGKGDDVKAEAEGGKDVFLGVESVAETTLQHTLRI